MIKYQMLCDGYILDDVNTEDYVVSDPKITFEKNKVDGLTFSVYKTHPYYDKIKIKRSIIEVLKNNRVIFRGRPTEYTQEFNLKKAVDVEGVLAFLNDTLYSPFEFEGSPVELFTSVINNHNSQVQEWQKLKVGQIDVIDSNDYVNRSSTEYLTSWKVIETRLLNIGGLIRVRYEDDGNYVDWIEGTQSQLYTATQVIEYGENLIDLKKNNSAAETYTAILPLGAEVEGETESKSRLTIEGLADDNSGDIVKSGKYIYSKSAVNAYGWIVAPVEDTTWDDVTLDTNLLAKAKSHLQNEAMLIKSTLELNAYDLSLSDDEISSFNFLDYVDVKSTVHGVEVTYLLSKLELPYKSPQNVKITVGGTQATLTDEQLGNKNQQSDLINKIENIYKDYVTNERVNEILSQEQTNYTEILQTAQDLILGALEKYVETGTYEDFIKEYNNRLELDAKSTELKFEEVTKHITKSEEGLQQQINKLTAVFRFTVDGFTIGREESPYEIFLDDNEISMRINGVEVLWFEITENSQQANIPELNVITRLKFFGYLMEQDESGLVNCEYVGG